MTGKDRGAAPAKNRLLKAALIASALALLAAAPARAALTLCNHTSYRMDVALGLAKQAHVSTRGWLRVDPGQCRPATDGTFDADLVYVHARTPPIYGSAPTAQRGSAEFCVRTDDFELDDGRNCPRSQQTPFSPARPSASDNGSVVKLAEDAGYDGDQARLAGIQRLLSIAGYDASPIDGVDGSKTQAALKAFLNDRRLPAEAADQAAFFDQLMAAARDPQGRGFSWCNDTPYTVMASLGIVEMGAIVTRGWYRIPAHDCLRPDVSGEPHRLYSYAEAVDRNGRTVQHSGKPLAWGGDIALCTQGGKFEISNQKNCAGRGLNSAGFALVDVGGKPSAILRFKEPPP